MIVNDLSKLDGNNWLVSYIYVDDPNRLKELKESFDKKFLKLMINKWMVLSLLHKSYRKYTLNTHHYKLFLWKKNEVFLSDLEQFVKDTTNNKNILHNNQNNPRFEQVKTDPKPDTYEGICI